MALFKVVTNMFGKQIGEDTTHPVPSFDEAHNCHLYSVVVKRNRLYAKWKYPMYETSEFALHHLVEEKNTKDKFDALAVEEDSSDIEETAFFKLKGKIGGILKALFAVNLSGYTTVVVNTDFEDVKQTEVYTQELLELVQKLKLNQDHEFVKNARKDRSKVLCVVYGVWQTSKQSKATTYLSKGLEAKGGVKRMGSVVSGSMQIHSKSKVKIEIGKGTPLAYKIHELIVRSDGSITLAIGSKAEGTLKGPDSKAMMEMQRGLQALDEKEKKTLKNRTLTLCSVPGDVHAMSDLIQHAQNCLREGEKVDDEKLQEWFKSIVKENDAKAVLDLAGFTFQDDKIVWPKYHSDTLVSMEDLFGALEEISDRGLERFAEIDDVPAKELFHVLGKLTNSILVTKSDPKAESILNKDSEDGKAARELLAELGFHTDVKKVNFTEANLRGIHGAYRAQFMLHDVNLDEGFETQ